MADKKLSMDTLVALAKRRGFVYPGSEIYGGLANAWDYGPLGVELKNNVKQLWWDRYVHRRDDIVGLDSAILMNPKVWQASGHLAGFADLLVDCTNCKERFRADHVGKDAACPNCGKKGTFTKPRSFNLMFKTFVGPTEDAAATVYLRPETAQGIFVNLKNVLDTTRIKPPFGIAQIGKAFRNEITPGNFTFRTREFEQMEIEYFFEAPAGDKDWQTLFEAWRKDVQAWIASVGIDPARVHELDVPESDRAHYSKKTIDFEFDFPFGRSELYGLAYRGDYDLAQHAKASGKDLPLLHVIEPSLGVDRTVLAVLCSALVTDNERTVLKLKPALAPYKAAVFPLLRNKPELVDVARKLYDELRGEFKVAWDDRGNIGKRYYAQDEIGTPVCITVDPKSLEDKTVTVRDRDTMEQQRIPSSEATAYVRAKLST
ncbi:MAG: glycine--tRNA ligase [Candidatus Andersenbacteria bacterium]